LGAPLESDPALRPARWGEKLEAALTDTMDRLAADAQSRDPRHFERLLRGTAGVGGPYDWGRRARAWAGGRRFDAAHGGGA
ncbi:MAG: acyltransferase, partial [Gluconacetobacter diazotrophicus]|nr:acyltransferase [Gluconacetobacter diazotrophicus]